MSIFGCGNSKGSSRCDYCEYSQNSILDLCKQLNALTGKMNELEPCSREWKEIKTVADLPEADEDVEMLVFSPKGYHQLFDKIKSYYGEFNLQIGWHVPNGETVIAWRPLDPYVKMKMDELNKKEKE